MKITCSGFTNQGNRPGINQDSIGIFTDGQKGMFVIADGMGQSEYGYKASQQVVETVQECWEYWKKRRVSFSFLFRRLQKKIENANKAFLNSKAQDLVAGSTLVILVVSKTQIGLLSVGDSRIYVKRNEVAFQVTPDDVWDNLTEVKKTLSKEEILGHKNHGKLTQAFGMNSKLELHEQTMGTYQGMQLFLVSDGIYQYCSKPDLDRLICQIDSLEKQLEQLQRVINEVQKNGAHDNYSIICVSIEK